MLSVLLISSNHFVTMRLKKLLEDTEGLRLIVEQDGDAEQIISSIVKCQPEVIVIDRGSNIVTVCEIFDLIKEKSKQRIIVVGMEDNHVSIFQKERHTLIEGQDVVRMITQ
jgi:DNA-binding NarL/FixJ family response regulator